MMASGSKLTTLITTPSRVANALDWKHLGGYALSLDIGSDRIGMALAPHPARTDVASPIKLEAVKLKYETQNNRRKLDRSVVDEIHAVVKENNVCVMVVGWPLQKERRAGALCGRVLHTLDCLAEKPELLEKRPLCLWTEDTVLKPSPAHVCAEDEWGRSPLWAKTGSEKEEHVASKEQYEHHRASPDVAVQIWRDFSESQWPDLSTETQEKDQLKKELLSEVQDNRGSSRRSALLCESPWR